jgi:hypothetical protein
LTGTEHGAIAEGRAKALVEERSKVDVAARFGHLFTRRKDERNGLAEVPRLELALGG